MSDRNDRGLQRAGDEENVAMSTSENDELSNRERWCAYLREGCEGRGVVKTMIQILGSRFVVLLVVWFK